MAKNSRNKNAPAISESENPIHPILVGKKVVERVEHHMEQHMGPIPSPEVFKRYGEIVHDAPERILKVFEQDSQHTRDMQKIALTGEVSRDARAQWMAFVIMIAALGVTTAVIILGKNLTAGIITSLGTLFLALRVLFVGKNKKDPRESEESNSEDEL